MTSVLAIALFMLLLGCVSVALQRINRWLRLWHGGIHFRSYTEIAWAEWFERRGIGYAYEPQPFFFKRNGKGCGYLPDFRLTANAPHWLGPWVEVKGKPPTAYEVWKCEQLALRTRERVSLVAGSPWRRTIWQCRPGERMHVAFKS